jgi:hypothetical protein
MPALASNLRKTLETTVVKARELAERGAHDALTALAVGASEPFASMSEEERKLRNRLRAHGRQLGDQRDPQKGTQGIERLVREMAYEHWHRMLFARFLAENQLLIEPTSGVAMSLEECEELAAEEGTDLWGLAAQFAQEMLPQIFRVDDPVLAAKLPLEIRQQLQGLLSGVEVNVFTASDSLGWTYQFWQTKRKKEVNDSGVKIGADELSPVTQLFTEDYMVDFLLDNTLGAWHAGKVLAANPQLAATAQSEEELRQAVSLPGCLWAYLRFIQAGDGVWAPAAGTFEGWPKTAAELKCLDPCMGSGHFVVAMFERLVALRLAETDLDAVSVVAAVIKDNLFGLEIDQRCTQIGAFSLAMAAWRHVGYCMLPTMNLACSGLAPNARKDEWLALAGDNERLKNGMARLFQLFDEASVLGSLINPRFEATDLLVAGFAELEPLLRDALSREAIEDNVQEIAVTARGLALAAGILVERFTLVATNPPYLTYGKQGEHLQRFLESVYPLSASDLATCFLSRISDLVAHGGTHATVTPQNWLHQKSYEKIRRELLAQQTLSLFARVGSGATSQASWDVLRALCVWTNSRPCADALSSGLDVPAPGESERAAGLLAETVWAIGSQQILESVDARILLSLSEESKLLGRVASAFQGVKTGDDGRLRRLIWEVSELGERWQPILSTTDETKPISGMNGIVDWHNDGSMVARRQGVSAWGRFGVAASRMRQLPCSRYFGNIFDSNVFAIIPKDPSLVAALWAFCESDDFNAEVRKVDQSLAVTNGAFSQIDFDEDQWRKVASERYPQGLPVPFTSDPTQWLFAGLPLGSDQPLHVGVARLLGYKWPRQTGSSFPDCSAIGRDGLEDFVDADGIVCLAPVRGEASAVERLRKLLAAALGDDWTAAKVRELLLATAVDNNARNADPDLETWLRNSFFSEHCKLFHSRPFIWQIWDGNPHGFSALVNYHKLAAPNGQGRKTLDQLTFTYLGDWIDRQKDDQAKGINGADDRLAAALDLQSQLKKILEGEPPYDIFVRWKPLHQQAIGWDPDISDGVRLNIRPFLSAHLRKGGKTGAGILRAKPGTIKWAKDRGKEPMRSKDDFPWFWGWDENSPAIATDFGAPVPGAPPPGDSFDGNRWNDLHYNRAAKEAARASHRGEG